MEQRPSWEANGFSANQEIHRVLWNPKAHYHIHKNPPFVTILSPRNPVHASPPHFLKAPFDIIFPSTPRSSKWPLSLRSPDQNRLLSPIFATCPSPFYHPNNIHVPDLKSLLRRICCAKGSVQVRGLSKCLVTSYFFTLAVSSTSSNPQAGGPQLVCCPRLFIQYILSFLPYLEAFPALATRGRPVLCWQWPTRNKCRKLSGCK